MGLLDDAREARRAEEHHRAEEEAREVARREVEAEEDWRAALAATRARHEGPARQALAEWEARVGVTAEDVAVNVSEDELILKWKADGQVFWVKSTNEYGIHLIHIERSIPDHLRGKLQYLKDDKVSLPATTLEQIGYALTDAAIWEKEQQAKDDYDRWLTTFG